MFKFIDPRGDTATAIEPYTLSKDLTAEASAGTTVGLLANGFPDSENFVRAVGAAIQQHIPSIQTLVWNKGNAGVEVSDDMAAEILDRCQVTIAAYGH
ncbi:MAG: hypothetical protein GWP70_08020 [Proteobacteria bacterium]|nr:hypothetical protein [Pseudomonadota bacterium]